MKRRAIVLVVCLCLVLARSAAAGPLDVQVKEVRSSDTSVSAAVELREVVPDRFRKLIDDGGVLHLRVQAELWETRSVWDRLVYPAIVRVFRITRLRPGGDISLSDVSGQPTPVGDPLPLVLTLGDKGRVTESNRYYVHVVATLGTLADREADVISDAVFGRPADADSLSSLGRLLFRSALQVSDYLQSVTAETKSARLAGRDVLRR